MHYLGGDFFFSSLSSSCMVFEDGGDGKNELYCVQLDFAWYNGGQNFSEIIAILATYTGLTAKSGDFEVTDSSCQFHGIGHFLRESAIS